MTKTFLALSLLFTTLVAAFGQFGDPFGVSVELKGDEVKVSVAVPDRHYLYVDSFKVTDAAGNEQKTESQPATKSIVDPNTGKPKPVYAESFSAVYDWAPGEGGAVAVHVKYWGCNDEVCFIPQTKVVELEPSMPAKEPGAVPTAKATDWQRELDHFEVRGMAAGFMRADPFLRFLDSAEGDCPDCPVGGFKLFLTDPVAFVRESGILWAIAFILIGGLMLNLTPCVLPMIPINLAIIGAGAQAGSKRRGFALGATYGLGIALVYGLLGVLVVLTGSQFGTIQANPWFNLVIAAIFVVLALAMFDLLHIDFSRFQSKIGGGAPKQGNYHVALAMGAVAALLAGACVAPVVIAVLLLATNIYEANTVAGLALPFVLGLGMALPWPFAGAGLSFLPKPGKWMEFVKYGFGVGIVLMALYYGNLSFRAFRPADVAAEGDAHLVVDGATNEELAAALRQAKDEGKPVFIDFWASWCKNCKVMDKTTFKDEVVKALLADYAFIKYVAEDPTDPETQALMKRFGVQGLPTFVVLQAK
ncbi:cytochrome c biogenesis protein CcdA [Pontiella sp.]|uniref:protein-disulfide reductase DsbD family protein n=1 Tax=Pontiella sp. TaxID=2837462 RepID=UPI0035679A94